MSPNIPNKTLKELALSSVSTLVWECTVALRRKWTTFECEPCREETIAVSSKLFDKVPTAIHNDLTNHTINKLFPSKISPLWVEDSVPQSHEDYKLLMTTIRICLRLLFAPRKVTRLNLTMPYFDKPFNRDGLIEVISLFGDVLVEYHLCSDNTEDLNLFYKRPSYADNRPIEADYSIVKALCDHCPNLKKLSAYINNGTFVGTDLLKLAKLTHLTLYIKHNEDSEPVLFSHIRNLLYTSTSLEHVSMEIDTTKECLSKLVKPDSAIKCEVSLYNTVLASEIRFVSKFIPNMVDLTLEWSTCVEHTQPLLISADINEDIMQLSSLRLERLVLSGFNNINSQLMTFLETQSSTLIFVDFLKMRNASKDEILSISSVCPKLEELEIQFTERSDETNQLTNATKTKLPSRSAVCFAHVHKLIIRTNAEFIEATTSAVLNSMCHTPRCIKLKLNNTADNDEEEEESVVIPQLEEFILKRMTGNQEIETLILGFYLKPETTWHLVRECPRLKRMYYWLSDDLYDDDGVMPRDTTTREELEAYVANNNLDFQYGWYDYWLEK